MINCEFLHAATVMIESKMIPLLIKKALIINMSNIKSSYKISSTSLLGCCSKNFPIGILSTLSYDYELKKYELQAFEGCFGNLFCFDFISEIVT